MLLAADACNLTAIAAGWSVLLHGLVSVLLTLEL